MKYSELNDRDRWAAIRAGVKAGYNSIDDIEKAYNEYAEGGHLKQDDYYNNVLLQKDSNQKQYIKEQLEKRKTYANGGNAHKFANGSNIYGYSENNDALTLYKDIDDIYVTPNGNYYQGEEFNKRKQQDIIADINNNPALLFRPEYSKWYNYYRTEAKKQGWDFDETMSTMFNRLPFESQEWIVQNNPGAFRLLPQNIQSDYITRTKGMRFGAFQRLVDNAGENFLGKSVNNAVTAASLISLPTALKSGRLIKSGIDKVADVGYKALNSTNVGRNATNLITKAVLPAVETKWGIEGAMNLPNDLRNVGQAAREGDYLGAALEGVNTAFDASMIPIGGKAVSKGLRSVDNASKGISEETANVFANIGNKNIINNKNIQLANIDNGFNSYNNKLKETEDIAKKLNLNLLSENITTPFGIYEEGVHYKKFPYIDNHTKTVFEEQVKPRFFNDVDRKDLMNWNKDYKKEWDEEFENVYNFPEQEWSEGMMGDYRRLFNNNARGFHGNKTIITSENKNILGDKVHERRHELQSQIGSTNSEKMYLDNAYKDLNIGAEGYENELEFEAINTEGRYTLLNRLGWIKNNPNKSLEENLIDQNNLIKNCSDEEFMQSLYRTTGYWENIIDDIKNKYSGKDLHEKIKKIKEAMMYVGCSSSLLTLEKLNNNE